MLIMLLIKNSMEQYDELDEEILNCYKENNFVESILNLETQNVTTELKLKNQELNDENSKKINL